VIVGDPVEQPVVQRRERRWGRGGLRQADQLPEPGAVDVAAVVVERYGHIQRVPGGDQVGDARVERNPVQRGVRFDESPVLLRGKLGEHLFPRRDQVIQPRR